ncbi:MAG: M3 family oligoendopeptidase [Planctomycetes bacterium]|nr:M3 family oligoendopeptidase [Planctomycetota bacterium]MBL7152578.1 M3 family oligoendopeptidase [Phycisphaerae bacterium]
MKYLLIASASTLLLVTSCARNTEEKRLQDFINGHVAVVDPLTAKANLAYWDASTTGKPEDYDKLGKLQLDIRRIYSDPQDFAFLKETKESGAVKNAKLARQLDKLYNAYLTNQIPPDLLKKLVETDTKVQEKYNTYRGEIDGEKVTMSDIYTIMTTERQVRKRELAWRASKQVGNVIVADLIELVKLRNRAAGKVGFDNYHTMSITAGEQTIEQLDRIFTELDKLTAGPFARLKEELDAILAESYGIAPNDLKPWHYHDPFFQRTPLVYELDLDIYYKDKDVRQVAEDYYAGVGLPVDDILSRSDLYDREGKYPHAFSTDIDRHGDVRILCNLQNTERWAETILHELGHAVYSKYHNPKEPWLFREPAHSFTTEGIAMFFGRLSRNAAWMQSAKGGLGLTDAQRAEVEDISFKYLQFQQILFARWDMVMYNFEKQLYADPDQDLNNLWWRLVEKYQFVKKPPGPVDAGWASKLHFTTAPCYYHNYMLGELFASQLHHYYVHNILKLESDKNVSYANDRRLGKYLRGKVLGPGAKYDWNEMIERATGEPLNPKYFAEQFVK